MPDASIFHLEDKRIFVAGHTGMAGGAVLRRLGRENCKILTASRGELDLRQQGAVEAWFEKNKPDAVFVAAAKVGGIYANDTKPAEFIYDNLMMEINVIHAAWRTGVRKLLFLGSSCIYPRHAAQPMVEDALLSGSLEPTNEAYAIAKIAGIKLCQAYRRQYGCDFISAIPTNLYGPGDRYDLMNGHVVAALIMKIHAAKLTGENTAVIWGSGTPKREFLYTEDLADGLVFMMKNYSDLGPLNLGTGVDITIRELAETIATTAGWSGKFIYDRNKPDGMPRKVMDVSRLSTAGWRAKTSFHEGMQKAYDWYVANIAASEAPPF